MRILTKRNRSQINERSNVLRRFHDLFLLPKTWLLNRGIVRVLVRVLVRTGAARSLRSALRFPRSRPSTWPSVGEEVEAKCNGVFYRATVAEVRPSG